MAIRKNMKAIVLTKTGKADKAFQLQDMPAPVPGANEILIRVAYSGLNFADVMARKGMYKDAPPLPFVPGYDVSGTVESTGAAVRNFATGDKVFAFTRFGGYAAFVVCNETAVSKIPQNIDLADATALATQYCTAYFCAAEMVNLHAGNSVLIHSAAGGVGTALVQYALHKNCRVFATAGSEEKTGMLRKAGVHEAINYQHEDFSEILMQKTGGKGVDVIFDAVGGASVKKGIQCLNAGGRIVCYGASSMSSSKTKFSEIVSGLSFGFYHPGLLAMASKSILGVNMLKIADQHPEVLERCLKEVSALAASGVFKPVLGKVFPVSEIAAAHEYLENRGSVGKVVVEWEGEK
jgi:NADPH:quinone reductase-like Zn-dependent oxidoreductase